VSGVAIELLDELRIRINECRLVLQVLLNEVDLNLGDVERALLALQQDLYEAYAAASLVYQGAALEGRWGTGRSRPKAVFARHNAAVRLGAAKVRPALGLTDHFERRVWQLSALDRGQHLTGPRPTCSGTVRTTGEKCCSAAVYLGAGTFAAHCYSHATSAERAEYKAHGDSVAAQQATLRDDLRAQQQNIVEGLQERWLQARAARREWVARVAPTAEG
jgi:hypothetical protein